MIFILLARRGRSRAFRESPLGGLPAVDAVGGQRACPPSGRFARNRAPQGASGAPRRPQSSPKKTMRTSVRTSTTPVYMHHPLPARGCIRAAAHAHPTRAVCAREESPPAHHIGASACAVHTVAHRQGHTHTRHHASATPFDSRARRYADVWLRARRCGGGVQ